MERLETRESVETRLNNSVLPRVRNEIGEKFEANVSQLPEMKIFIPDGEGTGDFIFLETTASPGQKELVDSLHQGIVKHLSEVHEGIFDLYQKRFSINLAGMRLDLQELKDGNRFQLEKINKKSELAEVQAELEEKKEAFPIEQQALKDDLADLRDALEAAKDRFKLKKQDIEHNIRRNTDRVARLENQRQRIKERLDQLSVEARLLEQQINDLRSWRDKAMVHQKSLFEGVKDDPTLALGALLLGNHSEKARQQLADIQHELSLGIPEKRSSLEAELEENRLEILEAEETIEQLKADLATLKNEHAREVREKQREIERFQDQIEKQVSDHERETEGLNRLIEKLEVELKQLLAEYQRSIERKEREIELFQINEDRMNKTRAANVAMPAETIGRAGMTIGALSLVLGLMLGIFAAFFTEFLAQAKEAQKRASNHADSGDTTPNF
jgi:DNA repair exonuclease SbcCD ATPase subunit